jgi:hypothetical protein
MSHPPTNSPLTYTCGIVGHSLILDQHRPRFPMQKKTHLYSLIPSRNS